GVGLGECGEIADAGGRRIAATDDQNGAARVVFAALAEHVLDAVGDQRLRRQFAHGRNAAVAEPAVAAVGARGIQNYIRFFRFFSVLPLPHEQAKRSLGATVVRGGFVLQVAGAADVQYLRVAPDTLAESTALGERFHVRLHVVFSRDAVAIRGE